MPDVAQELSVTVTVGEFNELIAAVNRSITWQQQLVSKMVLQAQEQTKVKPAAPAEPPPAPRPNGSEPTPLRPRSRS